MTDKQQQGKPQAQVRDMTHPPFPNRMTFSDMYDTLFNRDFMTQEEFKTICDAAEMYANGCLKHSAELGYQLAPTGVQKEENKSVDELAKEKHPVQMDSTTVNGKKIEYDYNEELREAFKAGFLAASPKGKEEDAELLELRDWKESAMNVMADMHEIGKELGVKLGESIHDKILPAIIDYKKRLGTTG